MGRPRKTQTQKQATKRANLANLANLEKMLPADQKNPSHSSPAAEPSTKHTSSSASPRSSNDPGTCPVPISSQRVVSKKTNSEKQAGHSESVSEAFSTRISPTNQSRARIVAGPSKKRASSSTSALLARKTGKSGSISSEHQKDVSQLVVSGVVTHSGSVPPASKKRAISSAPFRLKNNSEHSGAILSEQHSNATTLKDPTDAAGPSKKRCSSSSSPLSSKNPGQSGASSGVISSESAAHQRDASKRVKSNKATREKTEYSKTAKSEPYPKESYPTVAGLSGKRASLSTFDTEQSGVMSSISVYEQRDASQHVVSDIPCYSSFVPVLSNHRTSLSDSDESSNDPEQAETFCGVPPEAQSHQPKRIALSPSTFASQDAASVEDLFAGFHERQEYEANDKLLEELRETIVKQFEEIRLLQSEVQKLRTLNMHLQEVLVQNGKDYTFAEIPGYPKTEWLLSISQNAGDSDYLFIKELVFHLFPEGVGSATPTGRPSNNPKGRSNMEPGSIGDSTPPLQKLDSQKVQYMKDRLYDRRRILQEPAGVAVAKSKMINKHIANVIANNPSLRSKPKRQ